MRNREQIKPDLDINSFYSNDFLRTSFPDYNIYQKLINIKNNINYSSDTLFDLLNFHETSNLRNFILKYKDNKEDTPITGSFYKCRKLGLITRYDLELFNSFNTSALITLFFSLISSKVLTSSLVQGKYISPKSEVKCYFIALFALMMSSIGFIYRKKKILDSRLDKKYSIIYKNIKK